MSELAATRLVERVPCPNWAPSPSAACAARENGATHNSHSAAFTAHPEASCPRLAFFSPTPRTLLQSGRIGTEVAPNDKRPEAT